MGFFEKIKNMFTEEVEDDDVKVEQIKKEVTHVSIDSPSPNVNNGEELNYKASFESTKEFNKPLFFDDNDFEGLKANEELPKEEIKQEVKIEVQKEVKRDEKREVYKTIEKNTSEVNEEKIFKPTPIISPVYGILDKNYHKEDIVSKKDIKQDYDSDEPSIDKIRNKAYGTLEDELENTLFGNNSILFKKDDDNFETKVEEVSADDLSSLTNDISKELDELILEKEKYFDEEIDKKRSKKYERLNKKDDDDLLGFIDSTLYKEGEDNNDD